MDPLATVAVTAAVPPYVVVKINVSAPHVFQRVPPVSRANRENRGLWYPSLLKNNLFQFFRITIK